MYYQVMSFSHNNCDQAMREKLAFINDEEKKEMLNQLVEFDFIHEAFIVSTCNRVEIVLATRDNFSSYHTILGLMSQKSALNFYEIKAAVKRYDDEEAIGHIFSVVSSLDSLVVGESQITGQVKEAFMFSHKNGTAGRKLNRVISYAVKCAAEVRNATNISQNPISISSVAVAQAHKLLGDNMIGMTGVVVGAGEMGVLAAKHLLRAGCDVVMLGRDKEKVELVAHTLGENVKADSMDKLPKYLNRYRLLFAATSAREPVITKELIENETLPRLWFDMAIPRDIEDMSREVKLLAGTVSHDLQAPLTSVQDSLERVKRNCVISDSEIEEEFIRTIQQIQKMNSLIKGILEYSRLGRNELTSTTLGLSQICSEVLLQLDGIIRTRKADVLIERPMPLVFAHATTLFRIVQNLVSNAIKFVDHDTRPKVILRAESRGKMVRLWVIDNGIGIAAEDHDRIFNVFQRLHGMEEYPGDGLGLAIVRRGINRLNGSMGVLSEPGKGSRFWIELPAGLKDESNSGH